MESYFLTILEASSPSSRCQKSWFLLRLFSLFCGWLPSCLHVHGKRERSLVFLPLIPLPPIRLESHPYELNYLLKGSVLQISWELELQHTKFGEIIQSMTLAQHFIQIYHFKPTEMYYLTVLFSQKSRLIFLFHVSQRWNHSFDLWVVIEKLCFPVYLGCWQNPIPCSWSSLFPC